MGPEFYSRSPQILCKKKIARFSSKRIFFLLFQTKPYILSLCLFSNKITGSYIFRREFGHQVSSSKPVSLSQGQLLVILPRNKSLSNPPAVRADPSLSQVNTNKLRYSPVTCYLTIKRDSSLPTSKRFNDGDPSGATVDV